MRTEIAFVRHVRRLGDEKPKIQILKLVLATKLDLPHYRVRSGTPTRNFWIVISVNCRQTNFTSITNGHRAETIVEKVIDFESLKTTSTQAPGITFKINRRIAFQPANLAMQVKQIDARLIVYQRADHRFELLVSMPQRSALGRIRQKFGHFNADWLASVAGGAFRGIDKLARPALPSSESPIGFLARHRLAGNRQRHFRNLAGKIGTRFGVVEYDVILKSSVFQSWPRNNRAVEKVTDNILDRHQLREQKAETILKNLAIQHG